MYEGSVMMHVEFVMLMSIPSATVIVLTIFVSLPGVTVTVCPIPVGDTPNIAPAASRANRMAIAVVATWERELRKYALFE